MFYDLFYAGRNVACPLKFVARRARTRWSLNRYLELIVDPTIEDFQRKHRLLAQQVLRASRSRTKARQDVQAQLAS